MDRELLEKAYSIDGELSSLEKAKDELQRNAHPESMFKVKLNQCYGDFGKSYTNEREFTGDIAREMYTAVIDILDKHISNLKKALEES